MKADINLRALIYEKCSMLFFSMGKTDDALAFLNRSLDVTPKNTNAMLTKGYILERLDQLEDSNKVYDEIFEIEDNNVLALNNKAHNLLREGELEEALELINRALEINPKLVIAIKNKIKILKSLKRDEEALDILSINEEAFEKSTDLLLEKIDICIERLDLREALKVNEELLKREPENLDALNNLGVIYERNARYQLPEKYCSLALNAFEGVIQKNIEYPLGWSNKTGKAYAFFDCKASKRDIEGELPFIRECVNTPNELELALMEGMDSLTGDSELLQIAKEAKEANMRYVMEATYPSNSNKKTADELAAVLNQAYQSPLYQKGEEFRGAIFYKQGREYISRD